MKHFFLSVLFIAAAMVNTAQGQLKLPALSPTAKLSQEFSISSIEISYSRPSMRGRKIFGDVVPYGKVWRTGANAATKIKIGEDMEIAGQKIKAGEYALYTIPGKEKWEVILNNGTGNWGADGYSKDDDVARFTVRSSVAEEVCQTFSINITDITFSTCKIELVWERTKIVLPVVARNQDKIAANIDKAISHPPTVPYFQAANYYFETEQKLDVAKMYVDKALDQDPKAFYMWYLKARIEKKLGHNEDAIAAAKKSIETAKGSANEGEYTRNNQKLMDEISRQKKHRQEMD
jgi:tetratricopeptide (TPR) repeat protein